MRLLIFYIIVIKFSTELFSAIEADNRFAGVAV